MNKKNYKLILYSMLNKVFNRNTLILLEYKEKIISINKSDLNFLAKTMIYSEFNTSLFNHDDRIKYSICSLVLFKANIPDDIQFYSQDIINYNQWAEKTPLNTHEILLLVSLYEEKIKTYLYNIKSDKSKIFIINEIISNQGRHKIYLNDLSVISKLYLYISMKNKVPTDTPENNYHFLINQAINTFLLFHYGDDIQEKSASLELKASRNFYNNFASTDSFSMAPSIILISFLNGLYLKTNKS